MAASTVPFIDGMKVGLGYDRLAGEVVPSLAVQGPSVTAAAGGGGQEVTSDCVIVQDVATLHKSLGLSIDAGGAYLGFSGSAKAQYVSSCDFSSFSTYAIVHVSVRNAFESVDSPAFSPDALDLLTTNNSARFRQRFGDTFISGIKKGGEYFAIYQISGTDQSERESLAVDVQASFTGLVASGHLDVAIDTAKASSQSHLEVHVHVFRQGEITTADLNVEEILKTAHEFPPAVAGDKAFSYEVLLQSYDRLKNPNDSFDFIQIQNRQNVLDGLATKRFQFLALRDDISYILLHGADFQKADNVPVDRDELIKNHDEVIVAIKTMERQASECTRDASKFEFTGFDIGKFVLPTLAKKETDALSDRGQIVAQADPLAMAIRGQQLAGGARHGFDIGMAAAEGQTLDGPGKQKIHDSLPTSEQGAFAIAVAFSLDRNKNAPLPAKGVAVAKANPVVQAARAVEPPGLFWLGFDIATGLFGDPALGAVGNSTTGPGSVKIRDGLTVDARRGFDASVKLHLGPPPLARVAA